MREREGLRGAESESDQGKLNCNFPELADIFIFLLLPLSLLTPTPKTVTDRPDDKADSMTKHQNTT